jgi:hypothetical protein
MPMPKQVPEPPEWMAPVITTAWDRWRPEYYETEEDGEPGLADEAAAAWLSICPPMLREYRRGDGHPKLHELRGRPLRCHHCDAPKTIDDLAAIVKIGLPEDPHRTGLHLICTKCGPNEFRARALANEWLADRLERAAQA